MAMLETALHHMRQSLAPAPDRCLPAAACNDQEDADADRLGGATLGGPHLWCLFWRCKLACTTTPVELTKSRWLCNWPARLSS